jgi:chromosome condensin MukBEF MukE localization factor
MMENSSPNLALEMFPARLPEVFRALRLGRHLCRDDGLLFRDLQQNEESYRLILARLGYDLVSHGMGFYFLQGPAAIATSRLQCLTLFVLILFQDLEDRKFETRDRMWEKTLLTRVFTVSELPHFSTAEKRKMMSAVGITPATLHHKVLRVLQALGMLDVLPKEKLQFRAPIHRFVELCLKYSSDEWSNQAEVGARDQTTAPTDNSQGGIADSTEEDDGEIP